MDLFLEIVFNKIRKILDQLSNKPLLYAFEAFVLIIFVLLMYMRFYVWYN